MRETLYKIAVVGPESTGKSTLAQALARHFDTVCVPEYAREYCKNLNNSYTLADEINMFYGQVALEDSLLPLAKHNILISDTSIFTIKIWCDHLFGFTPAHVIEEIQRRPYDLFLLLDIDLPWEDDPLRDFPDQRAHFMEVWKKELNNFDCKYALISGSGADRLASALHHIAQEKSL